MGLFILPPRLKRQSALISKILAKDIPADEYLADHPDLEQFVSMINELKKRRGENVEELVRDAISEVCRNILDNTSVFKKDEVGKKALARFIKALEVN
jgi:UDPglucose--hexose-1-phosphate uridylyltransferase